MLQLSILQPPSRQFVKTQAASQTLVKTPRPEDGVRNVIDRFVRLPGVFDLLRFGGEKVFKSTAEKYGIPWDERVTAYESIQPELERIFSEMEDPSVEYPWYYLQRFHAYDNGNLNWKAAFELESAREVLSVRVFQGDPETAKTQLDVNPMKIITERMPTASKVLDVGCGVGCATSQLAKAFPKAQVIGIDLSPYFLSVAEHQKKQTEGPESRIEYRHMNAEKTSEHFPNEAFDVVTSFFVVHECPPEAIQAIVREAFKLCRPGGLIAMTDSNARSDTVLNLPVWKKALQHMTEPFLLDYFNVDMESVFAEAGFEQLMATNISSRHITWTAKKPANTE